MLPDLTMWQGPVAPPVVDAWFVDATHDTSVEIVNDVTEMSMTVDGIRFTSS